MKPVEIELFSPAERAKRNARLGKALGGFMGFTALAVPVSVIAVVCGLREAWNGGCGVDLTKPSLFPDNPLVQQSREVIRLRQLKGESDD